MSNPRHPSRIAEYDPSGSFYPDELTHKDGTLYLIQEDGSAQELYNERLSDLESKVADILYEAISISSFGHNKGTVERGVTVTDVTLSWATNKTPTTLTLDGESIDTSLKSKTISGLSITWDNNKTWKLIATDERGATSNKTTSITFHNGVYYGVSTEPSSYNSSFILGFKDKKSLRGSKLPSFTVNAGTEQYIYYCLPKRLGTCAFSVGGFSGGFSLVTTISFTNESGYAEDYYIYKSDTANLGSTTVNVS